MTICVNDLIYKAPHSPNSITSTYCKFVVELLCSKFTRNRSNGV